MRSNLCSASTAQSWLISSCRTITWLSLGSQLSRDAKISFRSICSQIWFKRWTALRNVTNCRNSTWKAIRSVVLKASKTAKLSKSSILATRRLNGHLLCVSTRWPLSQARWLCWMRRMWIWLNANRCTIWGIWTSWICRTIGSLICRIKWGLFWWLVWDWGICSCKVTLLSRYSSIETKSYSWLDSLKSLMANWLSSKNANT